MSDDLGKKIKQITDILGQENLPENIKGILSLLGSGSEDSQTQLPSTSPPATKEETPQKTERNENSEMLFRAKDLMDRIKVENDPRINLLSAIRPFLNTSRQKRISSCIRMLQMSNLARYLEDQENKEPGVK